MNIRNFASSENFFDCKEPLAEPDLAEFRSWRGRGMAILHFFKQIATLPLVFLAKLYQTFVSILGVGLASVMLALTLGNGDGIREFFFKQFTCLAREIADWVLLPAAVIFCLGRLLLAATVHPALYFGV
jgi:hypothetical protein